MRKVAARRSRPISSISIPQWRDLVAPERNLHPSMGGSPPTSSRLTDGEVMSLGIQSPTATTPTPTPSATRSIGLIRQANIANYQMALPVHNLLLKH